MLARIKKNDLVEVLSGKDKGKQGTVIEVLSQSEKVVVRGIAIHTKHKKAKKAGEISAIKHEEGAIHLSKVLPVCRSCKKPSRISIKRTEDKASRVCIRCQEAFE
jgi:large subunit ribosomal protein L24